MANAIVRRTKSAMTTSEELLLAAERLAEAAEEFRETVADSPPRRSEFADGELGDRDFQTALEFYLEDRKAADVSLGRALRNYRLLQMHQLSARAIAGSPTSLAASSHGGSPPSTHSAAR
jgi:hypothetical protein